MYRSTSVFYTEKELVASLIAGDERAFGYLYDLYATRYMVLL